MFNLPSVVRPEAGPTTTPSELAEHRVWNWASPMMRRALVESLAWQERGLELAASPYPPLLEAIRDGVWFGRDHTGGISVGMAWFSLADESAFEGDESFLPK